MNRAVKANEVPGLPNVANVGRVFHLCLRLPAPVVMNGMVSPSLANLCRQPHSPAIIKRGSARSERATLGRRSEASALLDDRSCGERKSSDDVRGLEKKKSDRT